MKKKQPQPINNIALIDPQFASRLTGKYGWLVNRSVRGAGFVYLTPSTRAANGRGTRDLHIRLQTNYANYYLKLLQTFQLEAPRSRESQSAKQVTVRANAAPLTAQADTAAVAQVRKRAQLEAAELRQAVRTLTTETARLEALRRTTRPIANQHAPMHQRPSTSSAADRQATGTIRESGTEASRTFIAEPKPLVEQRMISRQERLLRTTERTIRVSYERLTRLQTLVQYVRRPIPSERSGSFPSGNHGSGREPGRSSIFTRQTDSKTQAADTAQRQLRDRLPASGTIHRDQAVRRPGTASSRQAVFVHRDLRMAAWPRGRRARQEAADTAAAPGLTARRVSGSPQPARLKEVVLPAPTARPTAAVRLLPGRQLLPAATGGASATVRRSTGTGTEPYRPGESLASQGTVRQSSRLDGTVNIVETPDEVTSRLRQQATAPRQNERDLAFVTSLRSAGRWSAPAGGYSQLADSVRSRLLASRLSDMVRIIALPSRSRPIGSLQTEKPTTAARSRETGRGRRQAATLIYSTRERGGAAARSDQQQPGFMRSRSKQTTRASNESPTASTTKPERQNGVAQPGKGTSETHPSPKHGGASGPVVHGSGQQPGMASSTPSIADEARLRQGPVKPDERRTERAVQQAELKPGQGISDRSMLVSSSGRIRNWLLRTVAGSVPAPRLQGFAAAPAIQEHAKQLTGGRGLLQRLQVSSEKAALHAQERREQTKAGRTIPNPLPGSKSTAAYIAARGALRVTHRRTVAPGPPQPARSGNRVNGAASSSPQRESRTFGAQSAVGSAGNGGNSRSSATGSQQQGPGLGRSGGLTTGQAPEPQARAVVMATARTLAPANLSPRSAGSSIGQASAALPFHRVADRSVESIGSAWLGDPLLLNFSLAERLIHKQASMQGARNGAKGGSAMERLSGRTVTSHTGIQSGAVGRGTSARAVQHESAKPGPSVGGATVDGNQVSASRSTVQAASVVSRAGNAPGTPFGGRRLSGALALVAARLARWQAPRTITNTRLTSQAIPSSRTPGQPESATRPVAHVTARSAGVPTTVHSRTPGPMTAAAENTAAGSIMARESKVAQVQTSTAVTPSQQRVEAEAVRQPRPARPVLQAVRRSPALSQRQNTGTGALSTRGHLPATTTPSRPALQAMRRSPVLSQRVESRAGGRTGQEHVSAAAPSEQQRRGAEIVRQPQSPRPALQAMRRSPAMSLQQGSGTGVTARRTTAQPVSRSHNFRSAIAPPLTGAVSSARNQTEQMLVRSQSGLVPLQVATPPLTGHTVRAARIAESVTARAARQLPALLYKEETADRQLSSASSRPSERRPRAAARAVPLEFAVRSRAAAAGQAEQDRVVRQSLSRLEGEMKELRTKPATPAVDVKAMTDQMYREITRRMRFEQQRRGL
ncbi:hypothetical protein [Paenibacillus daejeonensis]|uniref:hypothetical protein n=1 Tax=Paenibacillus daejeonensis TaxID=135193 RepID=UPI00035DC371|nr:hypothetical protein [Paenibacillus daejeonensis]